MPKKSEGGWSGIGMANSGIDPTHVYLLNDHPTQIPPNEILGPVVQNCPGVGPTRAAASTHGMVRYCNSCTKIFNGNPNNLFKVELKTTMEASGDSSDEDIAALLDEAVQVTL